MHISIKEITIQKLRRKSSQNYMLLFPILTEKLKKRVMTCHQASRCKFGQRWIFVVAYLVRALTEKIIWAPVGHIPYGRKINFRYLNLRIACFQFFTHVRNGIDQYFGIWMIRLLAEFFCRSDLHKLPQIHNCRRFTYAAYDRDIGRGNKIGGFFV